MRPRFANRGSDIPLSSPDHIFFRFNEAPIRESGKSSGCGARRSCTSCFNEAPIRESGKFEVER